MHNMSDSTQQQAENAGDAGDAPRTRPPLTQHNYESLVDRRIADAMAAGEFANLAGAGKPQRTDDDTLVPDDQRAGFRLLKSNGFAPPWIEARAEIDEERGKLAAWLTSSNARWRYLDNTGRARLQAEYRRRLDTIQRMIINYNLTTPAAAGQLAGLRIADELARLGAGHDTADA
jgi:hypothetical protein